MWKPNTTATIRIILRQLLKAVTNGSLEMTFRNQLLIKELSTSSKQELSIPFILKTLGELKKHKRSSIQNFEHYYVRIKTEQERLGRQVWTLIVPYDNVIISRSFTILGITYNVIDKKQLNKVVSENEIQRLSKLHYRYFTNEIQLEGRYLMFASTGNDINECWRNAVKSFSVLQGIHDLTFSKGRWLIRQGPFTRFKHPEWLFVQQGDRTDFQTFDVLKPAINLPGDLSRVSHGVRYLKNVRKVPPSSSTQSLFIDSLRLFAQAMEAVYPQERFLSFWQLIENICVSSLFGGKTEEVIKRVRVIMKEQKALLYDETLKSLAYKRNQIVHNGIDDTDYTDVNILKNIAEQSIDWLLSIEKYLKTKSHIQEYFSLRTKNDVDKKAIMETLKFIQAKH